MSTIPELDAEEKRIQQQLTALIAEHERTIAPLKQRLAEIEHEWPKRTIVWRDFETGLPICTKLERMPVNPFVREEKK